MARALVNRPKLLLLDEPLSALDANLRRQMQVELKSLQREVGIAFVFVTHDQEEAMVMSDRIALLRMGELEQVASPREIYARPATAYAAQFIGHTNLLRCDVSRGIARCGALSPGPRSCRTARRCSRCVRKTSACRDRHAGDVRSVSRHVFAHQAFHGATELAARLSAAMDTLLTVRTATHAIPSDENRVRVLAGGCGRRFMNLGESR